MALVFIRELIMKKYLILTLAVILCISPSAVQAMPAEQKRAYDIGALYMETEDIRICRNTTGANTQLLGGTNLERAYNFFVSRGLQPHMAAGILGNMVAESPMTTPDGRVDINPRALQPSTTGDFPIVNRGYGIVQWTTADRQAGLIAAAQAAGLPVYDLGVQLEYVMTELDSRWRGGAVGRALRATTTVQEATLVIELQYEIHAGPVQPERTNDAVSFLQQFGSNAPAPPPGATPAPTSSNCPANDGQANNEEN